MLPESLEIDSAPVRAVFDCSVLLQAVLRGNGPAARCLDRVSNGEVSLFAAPKTLAELRTVLERPEVIRKNPHVTPLRKARFLTEVEAICVVCRETPNQFRLLRDPDDEIYINLAVAVNAEYLVTRDKDLLSLMEDETEPAREFRSRFPQLRIVDPVVFLQTLDERHGIQHPFDEW